MVLKSFVDFSAVRISASRVVVDCLNRDMNLLVKTDSISPNVQFSPRKKQRVVSNRFKLEPFADFEEELEGEATIDMRGESILYLEAELFDEYYH